MLCPPDDLQARPVVVDRRDLHVDQAARERGVTDRVLGDIADVPCGLAWPRNPERSGGEDPWRGGVNRGRDLGGRADEVQQHIGTTRALGGSIKHWRLVEVPAGRGSNRGETQAGLEAEFARLWGCGVASHPATLPDSAAAQRHRLQPSMRSMSTASARITRNMGEFLGQTVVVAGLARE
jgi:hypothetical protein